MRWLSVVGAFIGERKMLPQRSNRLCRSWETRLPRVQAHRSNRRHKATVESRLFAATSVDIQEFFMKLKLSAMLLAAAASFAAHAQTEIQWWHSMVAVNAETVNALAADFNAKQKDYKVVPVYKGV